MSHWMVIKLKSTAVWKDFNRLNDCIGLSMLLILCSHRFPMKCSKILLLDTETSTSFSHHYFLFLSLIGKTVYLLVFLVAGALLRLLYHYADTSLADWCHLDILLKPHKAHYAFTLNRPYWSEILLLYYVLLVMWYKE